MLKACSDLFEKKWIQYETKIENLPILKDKRKLFYVVKRLQQEKMFCEKKINAVCEIKEMDKTIHMNYGAFNSVHAEKLYRHFQSNVEFDEKIVKTKDFKVSVDIYNRFNSKDFLMNIEKEYKLAIHLPKNEVKIIVTGTDKQIELFTEYITPGQSPKSEPTTIQNEVVVPKEIYSLMKNRFNLDSAVIHNEDENTVVLSKSLYSLLLSNLEKKMEKN